MATQSFYQKWPLWKQITVALLVLCSLVVIATGEYVRHKEHNFLTSNIDENKKRVIDIIGSTAIESIITEDIAVLNTIVTQLTASSSDIVELNIANEEMINLAGWKSNHRADDKYLLTHTEPIKYEGEIFGYIHIVWDLQRKLSIINDYILGTYLFNSFTLFLFTVISILGVNWLVTRPMRDIETRLLDHTQGKDLSSPKIKSSREFANLYKAVDKIRELTISKDELQNEVNHRKAAQEELAKARDDALKATQAKSTFLANMSHEIRTPLTAIIGFSEALLDTGQTMSDRVESIQTVIRSGRHLQSLITDILDLSKIEAGKLDIELQEENLFGILNDVYAFTSLQAESKNLYCQLDCRYPLPEKIVTDALRLKQILINLCGNAVKFTKSGGIRLEIEFDKTSNLLTIKVIDTGIGMTHEQQQKIFAAFSQADASINRSFGGTGLGLHLSSQLADKLSGKISVSSSIDVGSCFSFSLNIGNIQHQQYLLEAPKQHIESTEPEYSLTGNVLLAEDNIENQNLITLILKKLGAEVFIANNGQEAVNMIQGHTFDLVLMDMQMPIMDGITATQTLRAQGYQGNIVALTANATPEDQKKCLDAGFTAFLTKPIDRRTFNKAISQYLPHDTSQNSADKALIASTLIDDPVIAELLPEYMKRLPTIIEELEQAYQAEDEENLRIRTHNLKSTSGNYGFMSLYETAAKLEFEVVKNNKDGIDKYIAEIIKLKDRIINNPDNHQT